MNLASYAWGLASEGLYSLASYACGLVSEGLASAAQGPGIQGAELDDALSLNQKNLPAEHR